MYLRSSTIGTTLPRSLAFRPNITASRIRTCSSTVPSVVVVRVMVHAFDILHSLVVIAARGTASGKVGDLMFYIHIFTLEQPVDNLS